MASSPRCAQDIYDSTTIEMCLNEMKWMKARSCLEVDWVEFLIFLVWLELVNRPAASPSRQKLWRKLKILLWRDAMMPTSSFLSISLKKSFTWKLEEILRSEIILLFVVPSFEPTAAQSRGIFIWTHQQSLNNKQGSNFYATRILISYFPMISQLTTAR